MPDTIKRKLAYENHAGQTTIIDENEIASISGPIVILGDPGLGKTVLTESLGRRPDMDYVPAGTFVRNAQYALPPVEGVRIVIDGLDEIASVSPAGGIHPVLAKLSALGYPPFVLSCREPDWHGAADRIHIQDDYGKAPRLLRLQPFDESDALRFLAREFPKLNASELLHYLASRDLAGIYKNPLTLRLLGEVASKDEALPTSRTELLGRACDVMLEERNPRHSEDPHALAIHQELLLAAGAICAAQLLCDRMGIFCGAKSKTANGYVHVSCIKKVRHGDSADLARKTRLFQALGEQSFTHVHRVVAEFLGAKWLARCIDEGLSERRILALLHHDTGVPTSLRGLHAWTAHFSPALAERCISADPYGVLRYGDARNLSLEHARVLLRALKNLAVEDPYFSSEDWHGNAASGLMRVELADDIRSIITSPDHNAQLRMLLIEAMPRSDLALELTPVFESVMFDRDRHYAERSGSADAIRFSEQSIDWDRVIPRLLTLRDPTSVRLACSILIQVGAHSVSIHTSIDTVLTYLGLTDAHGSTDPKSLTHLHHSLFTDLTATEVATLLDHMVARAWPFLPKGDYFSRGQFANLVRRLVVQLLEANFSINHERLWTWISGIDGHDGHHDRARKRLKQLLQDRIHLRAALIAHVLLTPCAKNMLMAGYALYDTGLGLYPTETDFVTLFRALRHRSDDGSIDDDTWSHILELTRTGAGIPDYVCAVAREVAGHDTSLLTLLDDISQGDPPKWLVEQDQQNDADRAQRLAFFESRRKLHRESVDQVAAGDIDLLRESAAVYLDRTYGFDSSDSAQVRVLEFLGDELGNRALDGFIAVLRREDLPSAEEIAIAHSEGQSYPAEKLIICGIAELVRRQISLETINRPTLRAAYMAWKRAAESSCPPQLDIGPALEPVLFDTEHAIEIHFREGIEPQLARQRHYVDELYDLTRDERWPRLAGNLAIEWLRDHAAMHPEVRKELMTCALTKAPVDTLREFVVQSSILRNSEDDDESVLLWRLADFVANFECCIENLKKTALHHRNFIWLVRDLNASANGKLLSRLSVDQLTFIAYAFGEHWPNVSQPQGITGGSENAWNASRFIRRAIDAIAERPCTEATNALQSLIDAPAETYSEIARHALALQRKERRDEEYVPPSLPHLQSVMANDLPQTPEDMRGYFLDRLDRLQELIHGSNTDMWEAYWQGDRPAVENYCRNRLIEHVSGRLPPSIRFEPEFHMPDQKRADIAAIRNAIGLPVEIKGQWNDDLWTAPIDQLDAKYTCDWRAEGFGVYIVLWFGNVPEKRLKAHPDGLPRPATPKALRRMLIDRLPEDRRSRIDVYVLDLIRPGTICEIGAIPR